jgi:hypothetical protein
MSPKYVDKSVLETKMTSPPQEHRGTWLNPLLSWVNHTIILLTKKDTLGRRGRGCSGNFFRESFHAVEDLPGARLRPLHLPLRRISISFRKSTSQSQLIVLINDCFNQ